MHKFLFTILLLCSCMFQVHAQDKRFEYADSTLLQDSVIPSTHENPDLYEDVVEEEKDMRPDTTFYLSNISIPRDSVIVWKNNKRFAYMQHIDSILKAIQADRLKQDKTQPAPVRDNFLIRLLSSRVMHIIFWAIAIAFILFILYKLFLSNGIFNRSSVAVSPVNQLAAEEEISFNTADYDRLINQSVNAADYRQAVRYHFLKTLVRLSEKEFVQYSVDKTDYQYVQEIPSDKKNDFASLVLNYEYVWYGNFALDTALYTGIEKKFSSFYNKIH